MGANATGQRYLWYWGDTGGMYRQLIDIGFGAENIFFLSYGDSTNAHPEMVDKISTKSNVEWAFNEIQELSSEDDLVYVYWVSHGNKNSWECHDTSMSFTVYENLIQNINARIFIGAYNPCYSGAVIPYVSKDRLISATSVNSSEPNSYGWAGKWRAALRGGSVSNPSDKNEDGYISMAEAYEWEAGYSLAAGEHPLIDDNGDGIGGVYGTDGYDHTRTNVMKDGYVSSMYALNGYYVAAEGLRIWSDYSWRSNGELINFPQPFSGAPVIVTSAQTGDSCEARMSCAVDNAPDKFRLLLNDHNGNPTSGYVQIIAVGEDTLSNIGNFSFWTERAWHSYGEHLQFSPTFSGEPVIVTNAQANGIAKMACAADNSSNNCRLAINDHNGNSSSGWVQTVAVAPGEFDTALTIWRACAWHSNGDIISFSPSFEKNPVIVTSAQSGDVAKMSCAVDNAPDRFKLSLYDHNGNPTSGWVQIIAVGGIRSTHIEEQGLIPGVFFCLKISPTPSIRQRLLNSIYLQQRKR
jgi:hypothetical protein